MMRTERIIDSYKSWMQNAVADRDVAEELRAMAGDREKIEDAFYKELSFGTGGLRGVMGAGTNRMNVYTVAKASQGLSDYINRSCISERKKVAVSYDSRIKSKLFAETAAEVFSANGIEVYIYSELMPTPCLSFAVRHLCCAAGVMITASHNPSKYNGYKVYGSDGCQITTKAAEEIFHSIKKVDVFSGVRSMLFNEAKEKGLIKFISDDVYDAYIENVKIQAVSHDLTADRSMPIIYSPLNGTGLKPVMRVLEESGYTDITIVKEQKEPDGNFPTCPYPNPETEDVFELPIKYAEAKNAELILVTDPDCDRVGIAVRDRQGRYILLSGNETGVLLLDYICSRLTADGKMPNNPIMIKTIVTTDMAEKAADFYGVKTVNVLTGFKYIGEQISRLEKENRTDSYVFGLEESYGYLRGAYVRDKDAVQAALLVCDMFSFYRSSGISILERLEELYGQFGYFKNSLYSFEFDGISGFEKMQSIMKRFRGGISYIGKLKIIQCTDYAEGIDDLPKSNVLKFYGDKGFSVVVRPSGTEPKLKVYISVCAEDREIAAQNEKEIYENLKLFFV